MNKIDQIRESLREVYDPELGVNIVDLGLVYDIREEEDQVYIQMTLTTPGCPMHDTIVGGVRWVLNDQLGIQNPEIDIVWEPRWSPEHMSEAAKEQLGYF
ncbi:MULTISPECIES: metal-sulfur cluster assembly factor [Paenibacillus]|jgi:metal-sulfur cluster biosynthetic enzyme|uniref:metal-sulfur cluster assembly factor n=1 Tax=Paenibacillus TaxID=44249 RepID=UPI00073E7DC6|nr:MULTISPECIES: iron-sulfur cluster assembly protein [Paenibacillus]MDU4697278.1 iron-sulfur cluster assembly protein [Paenibacillus sp.]